MGKGNRVRIERADERKAKKEAAKRAEKRAQLTHNLSLAVAVIVVVAIIAGLVIASVTPTIKKNNIIKSLHNDVSVTGTSKTLNNAEMTYLFNYSYLSFMNSYGAYASYFGLDTNADLKNQECSMKESDDENTTYTWYDYFMDQAKSNAEQLLVLYDEAQARNITLDDDDNKTIEDNLDSLEDAANEAKMSVDELIESNYGVGVSKDDIKNIMTLQTIASKAYLAIYNEPEYSDDDIAKYCEDNMSAFYSCDYKSYAFKAVYDDDADDTAKEEARNAALEKANALASVTDTNAFDTIVKADLESQYTVVPDKDEDDEDEEEDEEDENTITESELQNKVDATSGSSAYSETSDLGKWAFEKDGDNYVRKVGDTTVITSSDSDTYTVYYLTKTIYRDESATKNVRHILISIDTSDEENGLPDEDAKAKADELLEKFNAGDKTEDSFVALATENTMDTGSKDDGGLYENVKNGDMVTEFNDWLFSSDRVAGDTDIVKTTYGYHVMYFVGDGSAAWAADAESSMRDESYNNTYEELSEKYAVSFDDSMLNKITPVSAN